MHSTRKTVAVGVVAALLAAGVAVGAALGLTHGGATRTVTVGAAAGPVPAANVTSELTVGQIAARVTKSVVEVVASDGGSGGLGQRSTQAEGTGWVYDSDGHIVTNQHVISGASSVKVTFSDGSTSTAKVVGSDVSSDLAVLKVDVPSSKLAPLALGDSSAVTVGEGVVAIGDPFGLEGTVTSGIVSAVGREIQAPDGTPIEGAIQTDAAINHGNSGGPLFDMHGDVIGVTSQIESNSGGSDGIGFAIPSNTVKSVAAQLIASGKVEHAFLGVQPQTAANGVRVAKVEPASGAAKAGVRVGDVITAVDGTPTATAPALRAAIASHKPGETVTLTIRRNGAKTTLHATLGTRPAG